MSSHPLPACCTPLNDHWPLPQPRPTARLISTHFDPALLHAEDFSRSQIPATEGVAKRQTEFLAGRLCAREALQRLIGSDAVPAVGADRAPQWPTGVTGSITHSHGWAAAIVARRENWRGLGLDVETLMSTARAERLLGEILTAAEQQRIRRLAPEQLGFFVTLSFSLKESLFKALYPLVQQRFYFEHAELLAWSDSGHARLRLLKDLSPEWSRGRELDGQFSLFDGRLLSLVGVPGAV
ncbi:4'-phosphopantetheinyl transferase [Pseudomonas sp. 2FG]|uniref:4'-phosphopantetheinyl transferase family protein n=1 Tax=Pseudomonas sp. 2FG TaxID=2502191 RepID=UPI0010F664EB|nr:4'-phosphopantetheinyl transferase superfamily protein [Pseudomonas sp. 2FG]